MLSTVLNRYTVTFSLLTCLALAGAVTSVAQGRQNNGRPAAPDSRRFIGPLPAGTPKEAPGEVVVKLASGTDASALAARFGLQVKRRLRFAPHTYVFRGVLGSLDQAVRTLNQTPGVVAASTNRYYRPAALPPVVPSDPLEPLQWPLDVLRARSLWGITVGQRFVNGPRRDALVGLIDFGPQTSHPDLEEVIDPDGFDFILDRPYDEALAPLFEGHGTQTASAIAGVTNNFEGIASLPWEAVRILPCHVGELVLVDTTLVPVISAAAALDAVYFCIEREVDVINMSFADLPQNLGGFADPLFGQAVRDAYEQGIILVAASGDNRSFIASADISFPARYPEVISVGAVGASSERAFYSEGGPSLELMAPGGNDSAFTLDASRQIIVADSAGFSLFDLPAGYTYAQGTSIAAAYVSGAIATLITQGALDESLPPTEQVEQIRALLRTTARNPAGRRTNDFGFGIINPEAALRRVTQVIDIDSPTPNTVTESFAEPVRATITQPVPSVLDEDDFRVEHNGSDVTDMVDIVDPVNGVIEYVPTPGSQYVVGPNRINIVAEHAELPDAARSLEGPAEGRIPERAFSFRVQPRVLLPGRKMVSFPYDLQPDTDTLSFLFGGNLIRLARWVPQQNRYAIWDVVGSPQDPEAALMTENAGVAVPPVGVGFWARITSTTQVQLFGEPLRQPLYEIPIRPGFNLIGNPYPFRVPFNMLRVRHGNEVMTIQEAARRGLMRNAIWRYTNDRYHFAAAPNGELVDWEAHWVRAFVNLTLLVPNVPSGLQQFSSETAPAARPRLAAGDWTATVRASADGAPAGEVTLGVAAAAREGYGPEDLETPPPLGPATVAVRRADWGRDSGLYAQDLRRRKDAVQRWELEVATSQPGKSVQLAWDGFPAGARGYLQLEGSRERRPLTADGSFRFTPARAGVHRVTVVTHPSAG
jgi:subtilisin family serine protease